MSRKIFLRAIFFIIICSIVLAAIWIDTKNSNKRTELQSPSKVTLVPTQPPSVPQTVLQLFPNPALPDSEGNIDIDVSMNTYNNKVTATQFIIQYDPTILQFKSIKPDDAFYNAKVIVQNNNEKTGTITYSMELPTQLTYNQIRGNYNVAEMEFSVQQKSVTQVKILSASVTSPDNRHSVLKSMNGTTVKLDQ
jgi:hypothetical protein